MTAPLRPPPEIVTPEGWRVRVHRDPVPLEQAWRQLEAEGHCTVFQSYDWAACWYDAATRAGQATPVIVTVTRPDGGLHWLLPLCLHRRQRLRFISFADLGASDYAAPVLAAGAPLPAAENRRLMAAILRALPACDIVHLQKLPETVEGAPNPLMSLDGLVRLRESAYGIHVTRPWAELSRQIMQSRLRTTIRQQRKKIEAVGPLVLEHVEDPARITPPLEALMEMRRARFAQIGREDTPPAWRQFYHDVATRPGRTLGVSVTTLRVGGESVATCFGLTRGTAYHVILPTFAMGDWDTYRPGMLMFDAMLESFGPRTGFDGYFDFTIGDEPYKARFGGSFMALHEWMMPRSLLGRLAYLYWRARVARRNPGEAA